LRIRIGTLLFGVGGVAVLTGFWRVYAATPEDVPASTTTSGLEVEQVVHLLAAIHAVATRPVVVAEVDRSFGLAAANTANRQLSRPVTGFRDDCSGYVSAVMTEEGLDMNGRVITIYERAVENDAIHWNMEPIAGDLVFFDDTHDRNQNGMLDDDLTHIGIVLDVEPDGTVVFGHAGLSSGRGVGRLNLYTPGMRDRADGERINSILRTPKSWDPPGAVHLAGELFAGFARVDPKLDWTTKP
jgi:hypothetical protein